MTGVQLPHSTSSNGSSNLDDDGQEKRTGTWLTASAHIITAVIGSGVLSLSWAVAQLGWITGPIMLFLFAIITFVTSAMLCDCYRSPDPVTGKRNYTYTNAVKSYLGERKVKFCGLAQYTILVGVCVGYTITSSISMVAIAKSNCFHNHGHDAHCEASKSNYVFMAFFAVIQILLCQIPNFHKLSWLSLLAAVMSFAYALIGISLSIAKVAGAHGITADIPVKTTLTGTVVGVDVTGTQKIFQSMSALGNIAFAYSFAVVIIEIQASICLLPADTCARRREVPQTLARKQVHNQRISHKLSIFGHFSAKLIKAGVENIIRNSDSIGSDDVSILQRFPGSNRSDFVLAADCLLSYRDAPCPITSAKILL
ncbi:hypothetical protein ACFE04_005965 [Oxalis oulophora]